MSRLRTIALAASAVFFGTAAESAFALDHHCKIGEPTPAAIILDGCESPKDKDLTAPITCESTPRGTATGHFDASKAIKHNGRYQPQKVLFTGNCGHETISEEKLIRILYPGESGAGDGNGPLGSVHWSFGLGRVAGNKNGGAICFDADELLPGIVRPENLVLAAQGMTDVVWAPYGARVHQILAPECFVQIDETSWSSFKVSFYRPGQVLNDLRGTNVWHVRWMNGKWQATTLPIPYEDIPGSWKTLRGERYLLNEGAAPFVSYTLSRTGPSAMAVSEERPGLPPKTTTYSCVDGVWSRNECNLRTETLRQSVANDRKTMTWTVTGTLGESFTTRETYLLVDGRELLLERVVDPDGLALVTSNEYYLSGPSRYKLRKTTFSNGAWTTCEYDDEGRPTNVSTGWLSGSEEDPCRTTLYSYAPFLPTNNVAPNEPFDAGTVDKTTARVETELIGGIPVSKTLRSIAMDTLGYRVIEEVRLLDPSETNLMAAWTDAFNPRSFSVYMPDSDYKPCSRLPMLVVNEDGTATHYTYDSGNYALGEDGLPGTFEPIVGGAFFRTVATHGTRESFGLDSLGNSSTGYAGIPMRTTRDVKIETRIGKHELLRETYVCSGADTFERIAWTTTTRNAENRIVATRSSDGTRTEQGWNGDLLAWTSGADGILHSFSYDGLGRLVSDSWTDPLTSENVIVAQTCDAEGHMITQTKSAGNLSQSSTRAYDAAGRIVQETAPSGVVTAFEYGVSRDGLSWTRETSAVGTSAETSSETFRYPDGRTARTVRNGRLIQTFSYSVSASNPGIQSVVRYRGSKGTGSPIWSATVSDALGRTVRSVRPGFGGAILVTETGYDGAGHRVSEEEWTVVGVTGLAALLSSSSLPAGASLRSRTLVGYDSFGDAVLEVADADLDGAIGLAGPDVIVSNEVRFAAVGGAWWRESQRWSFPDAGSVAPFLVTTVRERLSGLGGQIATDAGTGLLLSERQTIDECGGTTRLLAIRDRESHVVFEAEEKPDSTVTAFAAIVADLPVWNRSSTGVLSTNAFDALGRVVSATDGRGNAFSLEYDAAGNVVAATDAAGARSQYGYDALGRSVASTNALGLVRRTDYDADGNVVAEWGDAPRVEYGFDEYGRRVSLATFRDEGGEGDVTRWLLDEATGLVTNKVFADGSVVAYGYTADGLLASRVWARGVVTSYGYDSFGNLISVDYSDATPDVRYAYDRLGRVVSVVAAGVSTNLFSYRPDGRLLAEMQNGLAISRTYDSLGRPTGYSLADDTGAVGAPVLYGYDTVSRVSSVSSGADSFAYSYLSGTDDVAGMESNFGFTWTRTFEPARDVLAVVSNVFSGRLVSAFAYLTDATGRRTDRFESGAAFGEPAVEEFKYDRLSQVVGARRYQADAAGTPLSEMTGRAFDYAYDGMGNRLSSAESAGGLALETVYSPNALNQYDAILHSAYVALRGAATNGAVVSVNGVPAESDASAAPFAPWSAALASESPASGAFLPASVLAVVPEEEADVLDAVEGSVYAPPVEEALAYDPDGNLLSDGRYLYAWDGENRLVSLSERVAPTNRAVRTVSFRYDPSGRLVSRTVSGGDEARLFWLDHVVVLEESSQDGVSERTVNLWGIDVSETIGGAAGVGGLLSVANGSGTFYPTFDGSGNASEYLDRSGNIAAHYEYSPFGETLIREGARADGFAYRFSTKAQVPGMPLYYYGSRFYSPVTGRWLNRDPIEEAGGINLYLACINDPINQVDSLGDFSFSVSGNLGKTPFFFGTLLTLDFMASGNIEPCCETQSGTTRTLWEAKIIVTGSIQAGALFGTNEKGERIRNSGYYSNGRTRWRNEKGQFSKPPIKNWIEREMGKAGVLTPIWTFPRKKCPKLQQRGLDGSLAVTGVIKAAVWGFGAKASFRWQFIKYAPATVSIDVGYVGGGTGIVARISLEGTVKYVAVY